MDNLARMRRSGRKRSTQKAATVATSDNRRDPPFAPLTFQMEVEKDLFSAYSHQDEITHNHEFVSSETQPRRIG